MARVHKFFLNLFGLCYTIPDYIGTSQFLYQFELLFTLRHCNPVCAAEQKSLRFVGGMKSNPVCAVYPVRSSTPGVKVEFLRISLPNLEALLIAIQKKAG